MIDYSFIVNPDNDDDFELDMNNLKLEDLYIYVADIIDDLNFGIIICTNIEGEHKCLFANDLAYDNVDAIHFDKLPQRLQDEVSTELLDDSGKLKSQYLEPVKGFAIEFARSGAKSDLRFFKKKSSATLKKYPKYPSYEKELHRLEDLARNPEKLIKWK